MASQARAPQSSTLSGPPPRLASIRIQTGQEHAADVFIPYYKSHLNIGGDQSIKDTYYSLGEVDRIRSLAFKKPEDDIRRVWQKQREQLHATSQERVKAWGNTIMGMRKKRLAAQDEKNRLLEADRQKVDDDWARSRETERQNAIERARMLQRFEDPRVKALHSQLLMSNVLYERVKQLEYKSKRAMADQINEKSDVLKMRIALLESIERDKQANLARIKKRHGFAADLKQEIRKRADERADMGKGEFLFNRQLNQDIQNEERAQMVARRKSKEESAKARRRMLASMIEDKQARKQAEEQRIKDLEIENKRFNEIKEFHAFKRNEYYKSVAMQRDAVVESVGKISQRLDKEANEKVLLYIEKSAHTKDHDHEQRMAMEKAKQEKHLNELRIFQEEHNRLVKQRRADAAAEVERDRVDIQNKATQYERETQEKAGRKKEVLMSYKLFHEHQIEAINEVARDAAEAKALSEAVSRSTIDAETRDFDTYAKTVTDQWRSTGKDIAPLLANLEKNQSGFVRRRRGDMKKESDTFQRLGFSVLRIPGTTINSEKQYAAISEKRPMAE